MITFFKRQPVYAAVATGLTGFLAYCGVQDGLAGDWRGVTITVLMFAMVVLFFGYFIVREDDKI